MKQWKRSQPYLEPGCAWYNVTALTVFASGYTRLAFQHAFFLQQAACMLFSRHSCFFAVTLLPQRRMHRKCGICNCALEMLKIRGMYLRCATWDLSLCLYNQTTYFITGLKNCLEPPKETSFFKIFMDSCIVV
jgi:hypothetical protein